MVTPDPRDEGLSILLVDDSAPLRALLAELLQDFGFVGRIVQAEDVSSTLAALENSRFEIAILDLNIPGEAAIENGIDLARTIKGRYPSTKVALLTALVKAVDRNAGMEAGADRVYDKGQVDDLLDWIRECAADR